MPDPIKTIIWADADQLDLIRDTVAAADLDVLSAGVPNAAEAAGFCRELDVPVAEDLRQEAIRDDAQLLLLACAASIEPEERQIIRDQGLLTYSLEPRPGSISELQAPGEADTVIFTPLMRRSPGFRAAVDVLEDFGERHSVNISFRSGPGAGTLFARLFDAMDIAVYLCGEAEQIDATAPGPAHATPETLRPLRGDMTANLRFADDHCACLAVSDAAGRWFRGVSVIGSGGCLRIHDAGFEWIAPDGSVNESGGDAAQSDPAVLIGEQIRRRFDNRELVTPAPDNARLLALCEAARLSCRTGQGEAPGRVMDMLRRV